MENSSNTISSHLILNRGFKKIFKNKSTFNDFDCMLRVHSIHYLFYSDVDKHFSIGVFNESRKGRAGGGMVTFNTIMIPKPIYTTDEADLLIKATTTT